MKFYLSLCTVLVLFNGCIATNKRVVVNNIQQSNTITKVRHSDYSDSNMDTESIYQDLNGAIVAVADQLFTTNDSVDDDTQVILTSFVDLNQLNKTTTFGRLISESMYNELHIRKFNVTDFRGQDAVSVNADGEFHITRDTNKLKDHIENIEFIVVGTYVKFENNSVLINARILDSESGKVISTARIIYQPKNCELFDICPEDYKKKNMPVLPDGIDIITDNCSVVGCPTSKCVAGVCNQN